jgi:hypothetical protein
MCSSGATCIHANCCFGESLSSKLWTESSSFHRNVNCSRHDIVEKLVTHSLTDFQGTLMGYFD